MDTRVLEIGVKLGEGVVHTIRWCCRAVRNHPFLVVCVCFLLFLYRSFPFIFSLLVSASPVLVCTAVLLGVLLSYGQLNIPEIEIEERKTDEVMPTKAGVSGDINVVEKNERCYTEGFSEEKREGSEQFIGKCEEPHGEGALNEAALLIYGRSQEVQLSDGEIGEGSREIGEFLDERKFEWNEGIREAKFMENHFASIAEGDEENDESDGEDSEAQSFGSKEVNVDSLDSPPRSPWTRVDGGEENDDLDSGSDQAESSSPDASMAEIMPMLDELHPLLDEEAPQPVPVPADSSDAASERSSSSSSHESDDGSESREGLDVSDNDDAGKDEEEGQVKSAVTWTEEDQNNLMELRSLEIERNQRLENLIMRRAQGRNFDNGIENHDDPDVDDNEDGEDEEDGQEDKEEQTDSPIAWTEEDQKNLMELRSSEIERNLQLENIIMRRAREHGLDNEVENHNDVDEDEDGEDEEDGQEDREEETKSPIAWTEEDQKNVMDLGWSEIERNQRLENLILRRRARRNTSTLPERNLALESYDLSLNIAPISTRRQNPFDLPDDSCNDSQLPPIPGSAPSVLLPRRNPFDIPYDSSEEKPDLLGDEFQKEFTTPVQPREPIFRRYESVNVRTSRFARQRQEEEEVRMRPFFVPEHSFSEESGSSQFQRQSSELSDSKVSSIPETDSVSSLEDLGNRKLPEEDDSLEVEPSSGSIEFIEEYQSQEPEPEPEPISIVESVAELVRHGSESSSSEEEDSIELGQVEQRNIEVSEIPFQSEDVEDYDHQQHMEVQATEYHSISDVVEQKYSSYSSSSSLSEVSERVFTDTGSEGLLRESFPEEPGISAQAFAEHTALTTTSTLVNEVPYEGPIYDLSPSSSSTDVRPVSDPGFPPVLVKRTVSSIEKEFEGTSQEVPTIMSHDVEMLGKSSVADSLVEPRSIDVVNARVHANFDNGNSPLSPDKAMDELLCKHLNEVQVSSAPVQLSVDSPTTQNIPETIGLDHDIPSNISASLHFETTICQHDVRTIVEEVDDIKEEIDGLLSELDNIGDFSVNQWESGSVEFEKHIDSVGESFSSSHHGETSTMPTVEGIKIEGATSSGMPELEPKEIEKPVVLEQLHTDLAVGEITTDHSIHETSFQLNNSGLEEILNVPHSVDRTLRGIEAADRQGNSPDPHVSVPVPLENTAFPSTQLPDGNIEKRQKLNLEDGSVEIKEGREAVSVLLPEKPAQEIRAPKGEHSTAPTKGKGKLSKSPSSSSSSSSSDSEKE